MFFRAVAPNHTRSTRGEYHHSQEAQQRSAMASAAGAGAGATDGGGAGPKETKYEAARRKDAAERARKRLAGYVFQA